MKKFFIIQIRDYIFIILTATIFLLISFTKSLSEENVFIIDKVEVEGLIDLNFSREKYINEAFLKSFDILKSRIILSKDFNEVNNIKLKEIKNLISSFKIIEEIYKNDNYKVSFKVFYNDLKVKKFLAKQNISFSQPKNISAVFFPMLFVNNEIKSFDENYFYKQWTNLSIANEFINFVLPLEDLEDVSEIKKMKNKIENLDVSKFVNKYDIENYVFILMDYNNEKLNVHIKTSLDKNKINKNLLYKIKNIENEKELEIVLRSLKLNINDIWKEANVVNLFMPLSIKIKFDHKKLKNLDKLRNVFYKIDIIDNYTLKEFNVNHAYFKIYYYGNPKKLRTELLKFGYQLIYDQGLWKLKIDD